MIETVRAALARGSRAMEAVDGECDAWWRRLGRFGSAATEYSFGRLAHRANWARDCAARVASVEHDVRSHRQRRGDYAFRTRADRSNASGGHPSNQPLEVRAKTFRADAVR